MYLDGLCFHFTGFTRLQTIYFAIIIMSTILYAILVRTSFLLKDVLLLMFTFCAFIASIFTSQDLSSLGYNVQYFVRGPFLFWIVSHFILDTRNHNFIRWNIIVIFFTVSASSVIHAATGFGFAEKNERINTIYNGFLSDTNAAGLSLILATILMSYNKSFLPKIGLLSVSALVCGLIDSKSGFLVCFALISYFSFRKLVGYNIFSFISLCMILLGLIIFLIFYLIPFVEYALWLLFSASVKGTGTLNFRMESWTIWTILLATRNLKFMELYSYYPFLDDIFASLFGYSFRILHDIHFVESDIADLIFANGFIGLFCVLSLFLYPLVRSGKTYWELKLIILLIVLIYACAVGHTLLTPASVLSLAIIFSYFNSDRHLTNTG